METKLWDLFKEGYEGQFILEYDERDHQTLYSIDYASSRKKVKKGITVVEESGYNPGRKMNILEDVPCFKLKETTLGELVKRGEESIFLCQAGIGKDKGWYICFLCECQNFFEDDIVRIIYRNKSSLNEVRRSADVPCLEIEDDGFSIKFNLRPVRSNDHSEQSSTVSLDQLVKEKYNGFFCWVDKENPQPGRFFYIKKEEEDGVTLIGDNDGFEYTYRVLDMNKKCRKIRTYTLSDLLTENYTGSFLCRTCYGREWNTYTIKYPQGSSTCDMIQVSLDYDVIPGPGLYLLKKTQPCIKYEDIIELNMNGYTNLGEDVEKTDECYLGSLIKEGYQGAFNVILDNEEDGPYIIASSDLTKYHTAMNECRIIAVETINIKTNEIKFFSPEVICVKIDHELYNPKPSPKCDISDTSVYVDGMPIGQIISKAMAYLKIDPYKSMEETEKHELYDSEKMGEKIKEAPSCEEPYPQEKIFIYKDIVYYSKLLISFITGKHFTITGCIDGDIEMPNELKDICKNYIMNEIKKHFDELRKYK